MNQPVAIGIDIGGTNTAYGIVSPSGEILVKGSLSTTGHATPADYISALKNELLPAMQTVGAKRISGIGVGAPNGSFLTGEIVFAPNLPWKGIIPVAKLMEDAFGLKTTLNNDANAAAIGEMIYGAARGMKDFVVVTLGTGLGSGFVANGRVIYGHNGFAGELGHVTAVREGRLCNCGRRGCLERYASATGIVITADIWLEERSNETILRKHKGRLTAKMIQDAAGQDDALALELYEFTGKILGQTLADVVAITSPEAIIFFGGLARGGDLILKPVRKHMEDSILHIYKNKVALLLSTLPDSDAAILGASALVWEPLSP